MWTCEKDGMQKEMCEKVENYIYIINPRHCLTQKCKKLNQFSNFWSLAWWVALKEYHQQWIVAYRTSKQMAFLYS